MRIVPLLFAAALAAEEYSPGPDSQRQPNVPVGKVTKHEWTSKIYPGTVRDYWVYVPQQYRADKAACTMVFQDGATFVNESGAFKATVVLDNLIHKGDIPVMVGVFINPGVVPASGAGQARFNRSYEYDAIGPRFPTYLVSEVLAEVAKSHNLSNNPDDRGISGSSSGGNASFNAAWQRPDAFHRVLSFIGGFTNLRGDHIYPSLVRKMETKPLRVFLQDGTGDINIHSNYELGAALRDAGYDYKLVVGTEGHNSKHGSAILPDALRWLWRDHPKPIHKATNGERHFLTNNIVAPGKGWELVDTGRALVEGLAADGSGTVYFGDRATGRIHRIGADGAMGVFREKVGAAPVAVGTDGRVYAVERARRRIVAIATGGQVAEVATGIDATDVAVTARGDLYVADAPGHRVWWIGAGGGKRVVHEGIDSPHSPRLTPDHSFLAVTDSSGRWVWSFAVKADGSLANGVPFHRLEVPDEAESGTVRSGAAGMAVDADGFLYVASKVGIQISDPPGRSPGILDKPGAGDPSHVVFGGPDRKWLFAVSDGKLYRREIRRRGAWEVATPPRPRL
jgi:sugar lactone lactonase YvrE/enterochelin esterase-like enzyme